MPFDFARVIDCDRIPAALRALLQGFVFLSEHSYDLLRFAGSVTALRE
jgi:hypothetical protein